MISPVSVAVTLNIVNCIDNILQKYTRNDEVILEFTESKLRSNLPRVVLNNLNQEIFEEYLGRPNIYVADFDRSPIFYSSRAKYIFIVGKNESYSQKIRQLSIGFIFNVVFVNEVTGNIQTFFPFEPQLPERLREIGVCNRNGSVTLQEKYSGLFPSKFRNSTTLNVSYFKEPPYAISHTANNKGFEIELVEIIVELLNKKANFSIYKYNDFYDYQPDLFIGNTGPLIKKLLPLSEFITCHIFDGVSFYSAHSSAVPKWKLLIKPFSFPVWLFWISSIIFLIIFHAFLDGYFKKKKFNFELILDNFFFFLSLLMEQSPRLDRWRRSPQTIILFLVIQSSFILNVIYKSRYTYLISGTNYEETIKNIEDIAKYNLKIGTTPNLKTYLINLEDIGKQYIDSNYVSCDTGPKCLNDMVAFKNMVVLKPDRKVKYNANKYKSHDGRPLLKRVEKVFFIPISFWVIPGNPLFEKINTYVYGLIEFGFVKKFVDKYLVQKEESKENIVSKISIKHINTPIWILLFGYSAASIILILENYFIKMKKR